MHLHQSGGTEALLYCNHGSNGDEARCTNLVNTSQTIRRVRRMVSYIYKLTTISPKTRHEYYARKEDVSIYYKIQPRGPF